MGVFYCEYTILPQCRSDCYTLFGGMTSADDEKDTGADVTLLGRWSQLGEGHGCCFVSAASAKSVLAWLYNWKDMCTIEVIPVIDDNELRTIILKKAPSFTRDYSMYNNADPKEGESLYWIRFAFPDTEKKMKAYELLANMTEEQDKGDSGKVTPYARYHNMGKGTGIIIASSPTPADAYAWAFNWASLCEADVKVVLNDKDTREVVSGKPDFKKKHAALIAKMSGVDLSSNGTSNGVH